MRSESGKSVSLWMTVERPVFPVLKQSLDCDVCIVGAGITGLSSAYLLAREGKKVVMVDDGLIVSGESQRTTAHITNVLDDRYSEIERIHGLGNARLAKESQTQAIDQIEEIVKAESIDCEFLRVDGYLFLAPETVPLEVLSNELDACKRVGFTDVELLQELPVFKNKPPALRYPNQAQFHIMKYVNGLCRAAIRDGVQIFQETHVKGIREHDRVEVDVASGNVITAGSVIIATNSPVTDFVAIHTKQAPYRTFVIGIRIKKGSIPEALYWDTAEPYHYVRLQDMEADKHEQMLIVGGEDHRTGHFDDADKRFARLEEWARSMLSVAGPVELRWSGQVYEPVDGLSFIGKDPEHGDHVYVATGASGMGMTNGTISAILLRDLLLGRDNPWTELYEPTRKSIRSVGDYVSENLSSVSHYSHNLVPVERERAEDIATLDGAIISEGINKLAAYRDAAGQLHTMSAFCTHLKGVVCWNSCEESWDCPVHGSRFAATGEVIDGPANINLEQDA